MGSRGYEKGSENKKIPEPNGFKDCTQLASPLIRESGKSYIS